MLYLHESICHIPVTVFLCMVNPVTPSCGGLLIGIRYGRVYYIVQILQTPWSFYLSPKHLMLSFKACFFHFGGVQHILFGVGAPWSFSPSSFLQRLKPRIFREMPSKPKAPEIAAEAKKIYIPYIKQKYPQWETTSYLIADSALQMRCSPSSPPLRCRIGM